MSTEDFELPKAPGRRIQGKSGQYRGKKGRFWAFAPAVSGAQGDNITTKAVMVLDFTLCPDRFDKHGIGKDLVYEDRKIISAFCLKAFRFLLPIFVSHFSFLFPFAGETLHKAPNLQN